MERTMVNSGLKELRVLSMNCWCNRIGWQIHKTWDVLLKPSRCSANQINQYSGCPFFININIWLSEHLTKLFNFSEAYIFLVWTFTILSAIIIVSQRTLQAVIMPCAPRGTERLMTGCGGRGGTPVSTGYPPPVLTGGEGGNRACSTQPTHPLHVTHD